MISAGNSRPLDLEAQTEHLEELLPYCLENKRRRNEFFQAVERLPKGSLNWLLYEGYRLALSGHSDQARQHFLQGYFESRDPQLRARFHWASLSLNRPYPRPADLDEMCQWLSGALHDGPAQTLSLTGPRHLARELAELSDWLRNPILEGQSLAQAILDLLPPQCLRKLKIAKPPLPLEQLFFRIFQEVCERRRPLSPLRIRVKVSKEGDFWLASWRDEMRHSISLPTVYARAAQLAGQVRSEVTEKGYQLRVRFPQRGPMAYR